MSSSSSSTVAAASGQRQSCGPPRGRGRGGGRRGRGNQQQQQQPPNSYQKFVPKQNQTTVITSSDNRPKMVENASDSRPRLTTPLRASSSSSTTTTTNAAAASSLEPNASSRGRAVTFVNYLPQDEALASGLGINNAGLNSVESQRAVDFLNDELSWLLKLGPRDFWREVARNESLSEALDSYLLFRNRWYDFPHHGPTGVVAGVIVGDDELSRRVFMTFYRMSSNKDPDSKTRDSLSSKEHADLLQNKKLLDISRLLDICSIYAHDNKELTRVLVSNSVKVQQISAAKLSDTCHHFLQIANTMHRRCSSTIEALIGYGGLKNKEDGHFEKDLLEVMDFINDAIMAFDAFVDVYEPASMCFSLPLENSEGHCGVLSMLRRLHDSLLPSLHQGFAHVSSLSKEENSNEVEMKKYSLSLRLLSTRIVNFGWKLLESCYLSDDIVEDVTLQKTAKMFPVKIDDPVIRGDILVQTLREINGEVYSQNVSKEYGTFLQNIETNFYLLSRIDSLRSNGWIFLHDEAFHVILQIVALSPNNTMEKEVRGPVTSLTNKATIDEDVIIMESKISQIKDLFPDYGNGFLSACLDVYNQNAEEVIQRILDGTLHRDLLSLDTSLEQMPPPKHASEHTNDKGKGVVMESETENRRDKKGKGLLLESPSQFTAASSVIPKVYEGVAAAPLLSSSMLAPGRYTRKSKDDLPSSEILDSKTAKDSIRTMALAAGDDIDEYEDEYDDSFDDLGLSVVESATEEVENEDAKKSYSGWNSQKKTQFYVKDGKNYSYKVSGSIAVSNARDAAIVSQTQREAIHGLGRGGNIPLGAAKKFAESRPSSIDDSDEPTNEDSNPLNGGGRGSSSSSSRSNNRGGRRGGGQYRKNQAMKKHFAGLTGF